MTATTTYDVFIAYAPVDEPHARALAAELAKHDITACVAEWLTKVPLLDWEAGIDASLHGIVLMSAATMVEPWVEEKYAALLTKAVDHGRLLIPVVVGEGHISMPSFLKIRRAADLRGGPDVYAMEVESIVRGIRRRRG